MTHTNIEISVEYVCDYIAHRVIAKSGKYCYWCWALEPYHIEETKQEVTRCLLKMLSNDKKIYLGGE